MKKLFATTILLAFCLIVHANVADTSKLYNPNANAEKDIATAIAKAKLQGKHVLIQAGGNWCGWCIEFNNFVTHDSDITALLKVNFIVYHLNYSTENRNYSTFKKYGFAQRFGFPVFIILDGNGNRLHTQNSVYLEEDKSYNKKKVLDFLNAWKPAALDEKSYTGEH